MMKRLAVFGGLGLVGLSAAIFFLYSNLDSIIQAAVEKYGTEILDVRVSLQEVEIDPASGVGALKGLWVRNPKGFETAHIFQLGRIKLDLDLSTVTKDVIVVNEISIDRPSITYEWAKDGSNFDQIHQNVSRSSSTQAKAKKSEKPGPKLLIKNLYLREPEVAISSQFLKGKKFSKKLETVHLKNIGGNSNKGASPDEVTRLVMKHLKGRLGPAVADVGLGNLRGVASQAKKKVKAKVESELKKVVPKNPVKDLKKFF